MLGVQIVPYDSDALHIGFQYNRGMNIFNSPTFVSGNFAGTPFSGPSVDLGDIDWFGLDFMGRVKNVGIGNFNWFASTALSNTHPNNNTFLGQGLLYSVDPFTGMGKKAKPVGPFTSVPATTLRRPAPSSASNTTTVRRTGSPSLPPPDDMWTSKLGTGVTSTSFT